VRMSVLDQSPVVSGGTPAQALRNTIDLARHADRLGYHRYWVAEHHGMPSHGGPAPEILVARLAAETTGLRVGAGGVLLSLYHPLKVVETFRVLHALHPGRIDLGIGRSPGGLPAIARALGQDRPPTEEEFQDKLTELLGFLGAGFPDGHEYGEVGVMPSAPDAPPVWLLGSSVPSAAMAAANGLPYSYAHFINPAGTAEAIACYRARFRASAPGDRPRVLLGIGVYCADTEEAAQQAFTSQRVFRLWATRNVLAPIPSPAEAAEVLRTGPDPLTAESFRWPRYVVGTPDRVRDQVTAMTGALDVDEVVVVATIHDHQVRVRSYELLAAAFDLRPRRGRE
jgi:luciferase family oxidoreductase group 1